VCLLQLCVFNFLFDKQFLWCHSGERHTNVLRHPVWVLDAELLQLLRFMLWLFDLLRHFLLSKVLNVMFFSRSLAKFNFFVDLKLCWTNLYWCLTVLDLSLVKKFCFTHGRAYLNVVSLGSRCYEKRQD